jgi:hypothetical protein
MSTNGHSHDRPIRPDGEHEADEDDEEFQADTPKEYRARQRFDELQQVKADIREQVRHADLMWARDEIPEFEQLTMVRRAVEDYIQELRPVILAAAPDVRQYYWNEINLGEMRLPDGSTKTFYGLSSVRNVKGCVRVTWQEVDDRSFGTTEPETRSAELQIPRHIVENAWDACNEFRLQVGLGIPRDEPDPHGVT